MEFQISKQSFFKELQLLQGIIEKKSTMPILGQSSPDGRKGKH